MGYSPGMARAPSRAPHTMRPSDWGRRDNTGRAAPNTPPESIQERQAVAQQAANVGGIDWSNVVFETYDPRERPAARFVRRWREIAGETYQRQMRASFDALRESRYADAASQFYDPESWSPAWVRTFFEYDVRTRMYELKIDVNIPEEMMSPQLRDHMRELAGMSVPDMLEVTYALVTGSSLDRGYGGYRRSAQIDPGYSRELLYTQPTPTQSARETLPVTPPQPASPLSVGRRRILVDETSEAG